MSDSEDWQMEPEHIVGPQARPLAQVRQLMRQGRMNEAREQLQFMMDQDPQNVAAVLTYGMSLMREDQPEAAAQYFDRAIAIDSSNIASFLMAAAAGQRGGNSEYAEHNYENALKIDPNSERAIGGLVMLYRQTNRSREASKILQRALEANPGSETFRRLQANDDSLSGLENALKDTPNDLRVMLALGHARSDACLLYTSPSPRDRTRSRMPSSA